jgi:hypothetical protein
MWQHMINYLMTFFVMGYDILDHYRFYNEYQFIITIYDIS